MSKEAWLISWIGKTDHEAAEGKLGKDLGPIATALAGATRYSRIYLLTNYDFARSKRYCSWLESVAGYASKQVDLYQIDLDSPIDYAGIYTEVSANLKSAGLPRDDVELTFHLSPGTPAMAAIWIILAKTRFPARLIQTSRERGLEPINFFFDLASDFLPEFLQRTGDRIARLTEGAKDVAPEFSKIIHRSASVRQQIDLARRIAILDVPVLILGETGTGKELFAEAIHAASPRSDKVFVPVNCGAIAPELASSELFGHKRGAFTGAVTERKGHFQEASGGTLFLDEVGDLPLDSQVRLLRALQTGEVTPLAPPSQSRWMFALSQPHTATSRPTWRPAAFAKTCSIAWQWASFACRLSETATATSRFSSTTSWPRSTPTPRVDPKPRRRNFLMLPRKFCFPTPGRAMSASCITRWCALQSGPKAAPSVPMMPVPRCFRSSAKATPCSDARSRKALI
jgi:hypothetical protein